MNSPVKSQAIVIERPREVRLREIQLTPQTADTIVVRTTLSAISSGTDMKTWRGQQGPHVKYPLVPGYENVGVVEAVGPAAPGNFKPGDRVMINECRAFGNVFAAWGGNARRVFKNSHTCGIFDGLARIPDNVTDAQAVLAYLACVALKGIEKSPIRDGDIVLVVGAGLLGISALQIVKILFPRAITCCLDSHPFRAGLAAHFADHAIRVDGGEEAALLERTAGRKADVILECSGNPAVVSGLPRFLKDGGWSRADPGGHIHLQGDYPAPVVLESYHQWFTKNLSLSMTCALYAEGKATVLGWMSEGKFRTGHIPVEVWPAERCAEAYAHYEQAGGEVFKMLFDWSNVAP